MSECFAIGRAASLTGLRGVAICIFPIVSECFAIGHATGLTGLRGVAICISPIVSECFAIGRAASLTGLRGIAIRIFPIVSESIDRLLSYNNFSTIRALNTRRNTLFGAGGSLLLADCLGLGMTASRGLGHVSSLGFRDLIRLTVAFGGLRGSLVRAFGSFFRRGLVRAFGYLGLTIIRNVILGVRLFSYV